jgi:hypothetical protein
VEIEMPLSPVSDEIFDWEKVATPVGTDAGDQFDAVF